MKDKFIVYTFLIIIFGVFAFVPAKEVLIRLNIVKFNQSDNWEIVNKSNDKVYDKIMTLETFIKNRYNNYFPFYTKINSTYYNSIINIDKNYLDDIYLKDNNDNEHLFYNKKNNLYYLINQYSSKELDDRMQTQLSFYNDINNKYPNINLALYIPTRYEDLKDVNIKDINNKIDRFKDNLNKDIKCYVFEPTEKEYLKYYYSTDHHYNSLGAEIAYNKILDMYGINSSISFKHKDIKNPYYGSMAKSILSTRLSDTLSVIDVKNDLKVNINDSKFKPQEIQEKSNVFYDYYVGYFNGAYDEIIYENNSNYNRNLLIIGDSMSWQVDYLLAHSFDKTYIVNTKYGKWKNNDLILKNYIEENKITHILFLREAKNLIFDGDNFQVDKKVIR